MEDIFKKYQLRRVINTRGPATILGASRVSARVRKDIDEVLGCSVETGALQRCACGRISKLTGAPAGCITGCTSAGIAVCCAAALTGSNPAYIKALPQVFNKRHKIIIQKGQVTGAGDAPIYQVVRMSGATYVEVGEALDCATFHLNSALDDETAAAVFVMEDTFAPNLLSLEQFVSICHARQVPVIVDAAYLTDFKRLWALGVDLAVYSAQKWLGGATAGIIAGRKDLVTACYLQDCGIGRPMKAGKEGILGAISAIDQWLDTDWDIIRLRQNKLAEQLKACLEQIPGVTCRQEISLYSPSVRLRMKINQSVTGIAAWELNDALGRMDPEIKTDDYFVNNGRIIFDLTYVDESDISIIVGGVTEGLQKPPKARRDMCVSEPRGRQDILFDAMKCWLDEDSGDVP